jgi:hypothetical protein
MSVGNTYQARQAADIGFDWMPDCAITSALAGGELDCAERAGQAIYGTNVDGSHYPRGY